MPFSKLPVRLPKKKIDSSLAIVNIVLLLIFFFLSTGSLMNSRAVTVSLPETTVLPLDLLPKPLLTVSIDGEMSLDGEPLAVGTLSDALIYSPTLHVLADRDLSAITLLDILAAEALIAVDVQLVTVHRNEQGENQ
jgi:biopolymer transport protein ExbD